MAKQLHGLETGTAQMAENIKLHGLKKNTAIVAEKMTFYTARRKHSCNGEHFTITRI